MLLLTLVAALAQEPEALPTPVAAPPVVVASQKRLEDAHTFRRAGIVTSATGFAMMGVGVGLIANAYVCREPSCDGPSFDVVGGVFVGSLGAIAVAVGAPMWAVGDGRARRFDVALAATPRVGGAEVGVVGMW